MPFRSHAQRRWMYANHPEMAKRWQEETPKGKKIPERVSKMKEKRQGFEFAETGPNAGETGYDAPSMWSPGKIKRAAGLIPSMSEQYYMQGLGGANREESMPIELVSMAGPGAAQGAQMVQMAKRLAERPNQGLAQRHAMREAEKEKIIQGLAMELEKLRMEKKSHVLLGFFDELKKVVG